MVGIRIQKTTCKERRFRFPAQLLVAQGDKLHGDGLSITPSAVSKGRKHLRRCINAVLSASISLLLISSSSVSIVDPRLCLQTALHPIHENYRDVDTILIKITLKNFNNFGPHSSQITWVDFCLPITEEPPCSPRSKCIILSEYRGIRKQRS